MKEDDDEDDDDPFGWLRAPYDVIHTREFVRAEVV
jgi:hypothetical protein